MISISYLIATRNRLPFLKITLEKLMNELQPDEEIVVIDGNSTDGTKEYLQQLFNQGKIHQFISEPDKNQAHAWNKAMLMAKGVLIKKIIDDDVFCYEAIRRCSNFMLQNPETDVCISNSLDGDLLNPVTVTTESRLPWYQNWRSGKIAVFSFGDVHMLIRKSALSYIGLYDVQFKMIDWEYSLRMSYLKVRIAYYTGYNAMSVSVPGNISSTTTQQLLKLESNIGKLKYNYPGDKTDISFYSHIKIRIGNFIHHLKKSPDKISLPGEDELQKIYANYYEVLEKYNHMQYGDFIY